MRNQKKKNAVWYTEDDIAGLSNPIWVIRYVKQQLAQQIQIVQKFDFYTTIHVRPILFIYVDSKLRSLIC